MADRVQQADKAKRLAERLRENLRRRKTQSRELKTEDAAPGKNEDGGASS